MKQKNSCRARHPHHAPVAPQLLAHKLERAAVLGCTWGRPRGGGGRRAIYITNNCGEWFRGLPVLHPVTTEHSSESQIPKFLHRSEIPTIFEDFCMGCSIVVKKFRNHVYISDFFFFRKEKMNFVLRKSRNISNLLGNNWVLLLPIYISLLKSFSTSPHVSVSFFKRPQSP